MNYLREWRNVAIVARVCGGVTSMASALLLSGVNPVQAQMTIPGQFAVSPSGAATYTIPIQVPPGVAGIEPKLALVYNSQTANGLLGMGWSLSGQSSIVRCPRTLAQDGTLGGVNFDLNDRYCLDGQRLIATVGGTDGANGTEYRTEQDEYSKVTSFSETGATNGPGSFVVKTKSGLILEFGKTPDSRIEAQGKSVVRTWVLNKVTDAKGNYQTIEYVEDNANGAFYPKTINYSFGGGAAANVHVDFRYISRTDSLQLYVSGSAVSLPKLMSGIDIYAAGKIVRAYNVDYVYSNGLPRPQLSKVTVCDSNSNCLPATTVAWKPGSTGFLAAATTKFLDAFAPTHDDVTQDEGSFFDVSGDGIPDYVIPWSNGGRRNLMTHLGAADGSFSAGTNSDLGCCFQGAASDSGKDVGNFADVNGDGMMDYVAVYSSTGANGGNRNFAVYLSKGDGSFAQAVTSTTGCCYWGATSDAAKDVGSFIDVNGDGMMDYVAVSSSTGANGGNRVFTAYLSKGDGTYSSGVSSTGGCCYWGAASDSGKDVGNFIDVNGDGMMDYVAVSSGTGANGGNRVFTAYLSKGDGTYSPGVSSTGGCCYWGVTSDAAKDVGSFVDVNGDGMMDYVAVSSSTGANGGNRVFTAYLSKGDGTYASGVGSTGGCCYWGTASDAHKDVGNFIDANGDGMMDYMAVSSSTGANGGNRAFTVYLSNGNGTYAQGVVSTVGCCFWGTTLDASKDSGVFVDANGDGMPDYLSVWSDGGYRSISNYAGTSPQLSTVTSISTGNGQVVSLAIDSLSRLFGSAYSNQGVANVPDRYLSVGNSTLVTKSVGVSNGVGALRQTTYNYGKQVFAFGTRRGWRGFQWTQSKDAATGFVSRTCYRQDWPYVGMIDKAYTATSDVGLPACGAITGYNDLSRLTAAGSNLLSLSINAYKFNSYASTDTLYASPTTCADDPVTGRTATNCPAGATAAGKRYQIYGFQSLSQSRDWDGSTFIALPASRTSQAQDNWGNVTSVKGETLNADGKAASGYAKTTTNTFMAVDTANWLLGRLQQSSVKAEAP